MKVEIESSIQETEDAMGFSCFNNFFITVWQIIFLVSVSSSCITSFNGQKEPGNWST